MGKYFDILAYLMGKQAGGGGGGDITVESKSISANGTYTAPANKAYSPVTVSVPNSYAAGDEGKVVSNGALVSQTAHAEVTANGTIDTTLNNSVVVNVSGGGVGYGYTLVATGTLTVSTTSTSTTEIGAHISAGAGAYTGQKILYARIRNKAGQQSGYHFGNDCWGINSYAARGGSACTSVCSVCTRIGGDSVPVAYGPISYGVFINRVTADGDIYFASRYNSSNTGTINGEYSVEIYLLDWPDGVSPFA